ncbi:MAG: hypothetical protein SFY56_02475 [Bacteroidota bacterium]|nr:hypothetical protein [Bacteroidota bacterium]
MKKLIYLISVFSIMAVSCKKTRTCECKNSNGTYPAGEVEATKSKAKKVCKDLSTSATECYLK